MHAYQQNNRIGWRVDTLTTFLAAFQGIKSPEDLYCQFTEWLGEETGERAFVEAFKMRGKQEK